jgi:arsenate reductase (glutaredoxin)
MDTVETIYGLPKCTTCQKAEAFFKDRKVEVKRYVDVKTEKVDRTTLENLAKKLGGVENLFSKRALKYRAMGLHLKTLSETEMLDLMETEYTFIKRPVVLTSTGKVLAGFSPKQYEALLS